MFFVFVVFRRVTKEGLGDAKEKAEYAVNGITINLPI